MEQRQQRQQQQPQPHRGILKAFITEIPFDVNIRRQGDKRALRNFKLYV